MNRSWHFQMHKHRQERGFNADSIPHQPLTSTTTPRTMDPTTLVTFLFKAPPEARTVELLGSWDNFRQPYPMHHDRRRGKGFWSGCFVFKDIIYDGDGPHWTRSRDGGLKQGGTYWYFYRLNDQTEAYDDSQRFTTACPLLPGQRLNFIEVPIEIQDPPTRCVSAGGNAAEQLARASTTQTLDPSDKYAVLNPPPVSRVHGRCVSDLALSGRLESIAQPSKASEMPLPASPVSPVDGRTGRFYSNFTHVPEHLSDRRSSFSTRHTWSSEAPSFAHSSVVDAYPFRYGHDAPSNGLSPPLELPSPGWRPSTAVSYEEDVAPEFSNHADPFADFDTTHAAHEDHSEDLDANYVDYFNAFVYMPSSSPAGDLQRPATSRGRSRPDLGPRTPRSPSSKSTSYDHDPYAGETFEDILSPSFSAATLSSTGPNTPYRLSAGCSRNASVRVQQITSDANENADSIEDVAERLRRLQSSYSADPVNSSRRPMYERIGEAWSGYSLPAPMQVSKNGDAPVRKRGWSLLSNRRNISKRAEVDVVAPELSLPPPHPLTLTQDFSAVNSEESFADGVFSELSFFSS